MTASTPRMISGTVICHDESVLANGSGALWCAGAW